MVCGLEGVFVMTQAALGATVTKGIGGGEVLTEYRRGR